MPLLPGKQADLWAQVGFYAGLGFIIPTAVVVGYALGWFVDEKLGTAPVIAIVMSFFGLGSGIAETVRIIVRREKRVAKSETQDEPKSR